MRLMKSSTFSISFQEKIDGPSQKVRQTCSCYSCFVCGFRWLDWNCLYQYLCCYNRISETKHFINNRHSFLFPFKVLLISFKVRITERERDRKQEIFDLLIQSPDVHNSQGWSRPKLGASGFFQVSHMGIRSSGNLGHLLLLFPGC